MNGRRLVPPSPLPKRVARTLAVLNTLRAGRLILEPQVTAHAAEMFLVLGDPAIYEFENTPPESQAWLERRFTKLESRLSVDGNEKWLNWVVRVPSGDLAGYVQATVTQDGVAHIAYGFASRFWRRGIGSASVTAMLTELSGSYAVHTSVAVLKSRNFRSAALLRSLGFTAEPPASLAPVEHGGDERVMYRRHAHDRNAA